MSTITLKATNATEQRVLAYLQTNASDELAAKINIGTKTLAGAMAFAKSEAKKMAAGAGVVCVEDETVFGWIVHFFEEDDVQTPDAPDTSSASSRDYSKKEPAKVEVAEFDSLFGKDGDE